MIAILRYAASTYTYLLIF